MLQPDDGTKYTQGKGTEHRGIDIEVYEEGKKMIFIVCGDIFIFEIKFS